MKKNFGIILAIALGLSALLLTIAFQAGWVKANPFKQEQRALSPTVVSYQGSIWDGEDPYNGTGYFRFAIVNSSGAIQYWSNDGNTPPSAYIALPVSQGLFSVLLGDTNQTGMTQFLSTDVFTNPNTFLRVWFSPDASNWSQIPDQVIAAVPYAFRADFSENSYKAMEAETADYAEDAYLASYALYAYNFGDLGPESYQLRVTGTCPVGYAVREVSAGGSVTCEPVEARPTFSLSTLASGGRDSAIVLGVDGLGLISFKGTGLQVAHCNNPGCTSATVSTLDNTGDTGYYTDIAIGADGLGVISYYANPGFFKVAHCSDITCSTATITQLQAIDGVGKFTSIAIGSDGYPLISYINDTNKDLLIAHCTNRECTSAVQLALDTSDEVGQTTSLVMGKDGRGLIAYRDLTHNCLRTAHCTDPQCTSATITTHTGSDVAYTTSLAIGSDGLGLIAYYDNSGNPNLKVAHCDNVLCSTATYSTHDVTGGGTDGVWPAITIGADGLGLISHGSSGSPIYVTHCDNLICSTSSSTTVSTEIGSGYTAITTGMDGFGLITFQGENYTSLRAVHCSNRYCIPYVRED